MARQELISSALGYASIGCWLFAQMPQILMNWRRKSADGLALPFLANWFLGDVTNLLGCILTDQLPFQTYQAAYSVLVDFCLLIQYYIYNSTKDVKALAALQSQSHTPLLPPTLYHSPDEQTLSHTDLRRSSIRSYSMGPHLRAAGANTYRATADLETRHAEPRAWDADTRYSRESWGSGGTRRPENLDGFPESVIADSDTGDWTRRRPGNDDGDDTADPESEVIPFNVANSLYSESDGCARRGKHVAGNTMDRRLLDDQTHPESSSNIRGRQLIRPPAYDPQITRDDHNPSPFRRTRTISTTSNVSAAASRRSVRIVFLGVFALYGLSTRDVLGYRMRRDVQGGVLTVPRGRPFDYDIAPHFLADYARVSVSFVEDNPLHIASEGETGSLIGRVSAWTCSTMYLTSRLPQIWKNFVRKSVDGLSMHLFAFAILGNLFYALSILASPKMDLPPPRAAQFLRASIPYLLGSGGVLLFDITILMQSFLYKNRIPCTVGRRRRNSSVSESGEEDALLAADVAN